MRPPSAPTKSFLRAKSQLFGLHYGTHSVMVIIIIVAAQQNDALPASQGTTFFTPHLQQLIFYLFTTVLF